MSPFEGPFFDNVSCTSHSGTIAILHRTGQLLLRGSSRHSVGMRVLLSLNLKIPPNIMLGSNWLGNAVYRRGSRLLGLYWLVLVPSRLEDIRRSVPQA